MNGLLCCVFAYGHCFRVLSALIATHVSRWQAGQGQISCWATALNTLSEWGMRNRWPTESRVSQVLSGAVFHLDRWRGFSLFSCRVSQCWSLQQKERGLIILVVSSPGVLYLLLLHFDRYWMVRGLNSRFCSKVTHPSTHLSSSPTWYPVSQRRSPGIRFWTIFLEPDVFSTSYLRHAHVF
jgi:hypothetical protein